MKTPRRSFRLATYVFTYERDASRDRVRLDMWRVEPGTGARYWVSVTRCAPNPAAARLAAASLVAWLWSLDVTPRRDPQAMAVAESLALTADRIARGPKARNDPAFTLAFHRLLEGRAAAA